MPIRGQTYGTIIDTYYIVLRVLYRQEEREGTKILNTLENITFIKPVLTNCIWTKHITAHVIPYFKVHELNVR
jgi:hypothetical protein